MKTINSLLYQYYPRGINSIIDISSYENSDNYKLLKKKINERNNIDIQVESLIFKLKKLKYDINDFSVFEWYDRCYNLQFIIEKENNKKIVFCIHISLLINYYNLSIIEIISDPSHRVADYFPKRSISEIKTGYEYLKRKMSIFIEEIIIGYKEFPKHTLHEIIKDVNFQDIPLGKFSFFNAFFLNNFLNTQF